MKSKLPPLEGTDLDRYSISVIDDNTLVLTDADTLQTWQIEILRNGQDANETIPPKESK